MPSEELLKFEKWEARKHDETFWIVQITRFATSWCDVQKKRKSWHKSKFGTWPSNSSIHPWHLLTLSRVLGPISFLVSTSFQSPLASVCIHWPTRQELFHEKILFYCVWPSKVLHYHFVIPRFSCESNGHQMDLRYIPLREWHPPF